jgi:hypothetical protein
MIKIHWVIVLIVVFIYPIISYFIVCLFTVPKKGDRKKRVYIAHPFEGKELNKRLIGEICYEIAAKGHLPVSPVHSFSFLNDGIPRERQKALELCKELVLTCDEVWMCGDWPHSEGCQIEMQVALENNIPIVHLPVEGGQQ